MLRFVLGGLTLVLLACQPAGATRPDAASAPAAPTAAPAAPTTIRLAQVYVAAALLPFWLAHEEGYFREHGLAVEAVLMRGSAEGMPALAGGDVQFMLTAPSPATIGAAAQDPDIVILGTTNNRLQYQFVANVPSFPELRGRRVAISRPGDSSHSLALQTLERFGLREGDVEFLSVGAIPERLAALLSNQVDATTVVVPSNLQAIKAGYYQLADLGDLGIPYIGTSVYARRSWADANRVVVEAFLKGLIQGNHAVLQQAERAKALLQKYLKMDDPDELEAAYQDNVRGTERALQPSLAGLEDVIKQTATQNPAAAALRAEQLVDLRFIQAIEASGFVRNLR
jgi:NitT/TauT family transport system substrate-binding protein